MTEWEIRIPFRDPGDPITDVAIDAQAFEDPEERRIVRGIVHQALVSGCTTAGGLVDALDKASHEERRQMLDDAREAAGLKSATDIDSDERFEAAQRDARLRSSGRVAGKAFVGCSAEGCSALPMDAAGLPAPVADRRWWCEAHRALAGPDDHLPPDDVVVIDAHFGVIEAPSVLAAMQAKDDRRREADEQRRRERAAEAEAIRLAEQRYYEEYKDDSYVNPLSGAGWAGIT